MIKSRQNKQIKLLFKLFQKKYRNQTNQFLVFGDHSIKEAKKTNNIVAVYTSNKYKDGILIADEIMKELSPTLTPFDIVAVVKKPETKPYSDKILLLDSVQDPGNVGALIRSAIAFGYKTIIKNEDSASFFNEKTVRATKGNIFYSNLFTKDLEKEIKELKEKGYFIVAGTLSNNTNFTNLKKIKKLALLLGNEGQGINKDLLKLVDYEITIPTINVESLNVFAAGSIIMYELRDLNG